MEIVTVMDFDLPGGCLVVGALWLTGILVATIEIKLPKARNIAFGSSVVAMLTVVVLLVLEWIGGVQREPGLEGNIENSIVGLHVDGFVFFMQITVLICGLCSLVLGMHVKEKWRSGSFSLIIMSTAGLCLLSMASDLISVVTGFLAGIIPLWGCGAISQERKSREAAIKSIVVGSLAAVFLGLSSALFFLKAGSTSLVGIAEFLRSARWIGSDPVLVVGIALIIAGMGCMIAAVPFHMWFVDAVEGLPLPSALLLSGGLVAAGLATICRIMLIAFLPVVSSGPGYLSWVEVLHALGLAALLACNAMAFVQQKLSRMVGYLAAGQAGLVLLTIAAIGQMANNGSPLIDSAVGGLLVFIAVFTLNWIGLFVVVAATYPKDVEPRLGSLEGLAQTHPWLAVSIGLALLCMAGLPLTAGFFPRLYLLQAMVEAGWIGTAIAAGLSLGLILAMSLGLVVAMVLRKPKEEVQLGSSKSLVFVAFFASSAIVVFGLFPDRILDVSMRSVKFLVASL
jgi:NADH-quinone oxidoreductase subunit N